MRERLILFNGLSVKAILAGRKSMTRRVIKPQPNPIEPNRWFDRQGPENYWVSWDERQPAPPSKQVWIKSPYGRPGDRLWVRETWSCERWENIDGGEGWRRETLLYRADGEHDGPWSPSIFMPKWATRIWLRMTDIRVGRVQDITSTDCEHEGISGVTLASPVRGQPYGEYRNGDGIVYPEPRAAFHALWDFLNAKRGYGWEENPWVWAIGFEREQAR